MRKNGSGLQLSRSHDGHLTNWGNLPSLFSGDGESLRLF